MTVTLGPELEAALAEQARRKGVAPEALALDVLREHFLHSISPPQDDWEQRLRSLAKNCGVSLPNSAVSSEGLYE